MPATTTNRPGANTGLVSVFCAQYKGLEKEQFMNRETALAIYRAKEDMSLESFFECLCELRAMDAIDFEDNIFRNDGSNCVGTAIAFAEYIVDRMKDALEQGQWYGYELKALNALEDLSCSEDALVGIDGYGFPYLIEDNESLLYILNLEDDLRYHGDSAEEIEAQTEGVFV